MQGFLRKVLLSLTFKSNFRCIRYGCLQGENKKLTGVKTKGTSHDQHAIRDTEDVYP